MIASPSEFIKAQIDKPPDESKKWRMAMWGLRGISGFFITGLLMFLFRPELASQVITLTQVTITAFGGIVGIYLGAQGTVEYKATAALETLNKNTKVEEHHDQHIIEEGSPTAPKVKPWTPVTDE